MDYHIALSKAQKAFKEVFTQKTRKPTFVKGENFMTPEIITYAKYKNFTIELSLGTGFKQGDYIIGATVWDNSEQDYDLSNSAQVNDLPEVLEQIKQEMNNRTMRQITVLFEDGNIIETSINGSTKSVNAYYVNNEPINIGSYVDDKTEGENMQKAVCVFFHGLSNPDLIEELEELYRINKMGLEIEKKTGFPAAWQMQLDTFISDYRG